MKQNTLFPRPDYHCEVSIFQRQPIQVDCMYEHWTVQFQSFGMHQTIYIPSMIFEFIFFSEFKEETLKTWANWFYCEFSTESQNILCTDSTYRKIGSNSYVSTFWHVSILPEWVILSKKDRILFFIDTVTGGLGGLSGVFNGFSLICLAEVGYIIVRAFCIAVKNRQRNVAVLSQTK